MAQHDRGDPGAGSLPAKYPGTFMLALREALATLGWRFQRWQGDLVQCTDESGDEHTIGLENIYRRCRREPREEWPAVVAEFLKAVGAADDPKSVPENLAAVADRLLVRIGPPLHVGGDAKVWSRQLGDTGLFANLVIDFPDRMAYVTEELVTNSGRPGTEWLDRALANLRDKSPPGCLKVIDDDTGLHASNAGDSYDSSRALILDTLLPEFAADGCFAALPSRDQLFVLPVNRAAMAHVHLLKVVALKEYQSTPYALSDEVFWVRGGVWQLFPIKIEGKQVTIEPPPDFIEVLERLNPTGDDEALA